MAAVSEPSCPECEKMSKVRDKSQSIGEFLEWLNQQGIFLAAYHEHTKDCYAPDDYDQEEPICELGTQRLWEVRKSIEMLLAEFFKIDLKKVEEEKCAMLESLQKGEAL